MSNQEESNPSPSPYNRGLEEHFNSLSKTFGTGLQQFNMFNENSPFDVTKSQNRHFQYPSLIDISRLRPSKEYTQIMASNQLQALPGSFMDRLDPINNVTVSNFDDPNILQASQTLFEEIQKLEVVLMQRKKSLMLLQQQLLRSQGKLYPDHNAHEFRTMIPDYTSTFMPVPSEQSTMPFSTASIGKFASSENSRFSPDDYNTAMKHLSQFEQSQVITRSPLSFKPTVESASFPIILHRLLLDMETKEEYCNIAEFLPDGQSFIIKDPKLFEQNIMPIYFPRMKSFASFQKQLNLYGFQRVADHGLMKGIYCHPLFRRNQFNMVTRVKKIKNEK
jgi:HSF-type DNA-binding